MSAENQDTQTGSPRSSGDSFDRLTDQISRSQRGYRELIDNLDQALFTLSLQGEVRVANLRLTEIFGASFQDIIGRKLCEFVEAPSMAELERALPSLLREGTWSGTVQVRLKRDMEVRYFLCWLQAVEEEGQSTSVIGWARDVTAQHESEIRFAELFESLREGILFSTPEGRIIDANPALVRMLGYGSKEEFLTHNFSEMYDNLADRERIINLLEDKGSLQNNDLVLRRKDGKRIHCLTSGFAIHDASGRAIRLQGTLVDVTDRIEIEKKLHREQEFVRRLIDCFPDMIAVLDREGRFTYVSDRVRDLLGASPQDFIGQRVGSRTHPDDQSRLSEFVQAILSGRAEYAQFESRVQHLDGSWRVLRATASPLFGDEGGISGVVASVRDVTESNLAEEQLARKEKFTAMGQMLAGAAHELNNPLTAILGVSDLLHERASDDATRHQTDLILQQARRAAGIVQNLLAFSRPATQGRLKLRVDEILREVLRGEHPALARKNIAVKFEPPDGLPLVEGDRRLLAQVFSNLIANAEQSIAGARDRGTIEISLREVEDGVCATIADDGPGIAPGNMSKVFDPFFTTKRPGGGSGLGLTICLAVVKDHGGNIEVSSSPGAGASFRVFLPAVREGIKEPVSPVLAGQAAPSGSQPLAGHRVLIVDDEESIREIVHEGLAARGMKVHSVSSSEEALAYLAGNACDVVVCDFNLPGISGEKFFERLSADQRTAQVPRFVFMTGDLVDAAFSENLRRQGSRFLQKPFHVSALADVLVNLLQPQVSETR
jgi:PAS domain S-box-containing protein